LENPENSAEKICNLLFFYTTLKFIKLIISKQEKFENKFFVKEGDEIIVNYLIKKFGKYKKNPIEFFKLKVGEHVEEEIKNILKEKILNFENIIKEKIKREKFTKKRKLDGM